MKILKSGLKFDPSWFITYLRYILFCLIVNSKKTKDIKIERHHILPRSLFPAYIDLKTNPWNEAKLTPRQHHIAHRLLAKCFTTSMPVAFYNMQQIGKTSRIYSQKVQT